MLQALGLLWRSTGGPLKMRKSVLDHSRDELAAMRTLVPSAELAKIDAHAEVVRKIEEQL